jgi:hypothetical protein
MPSETLRINLNEFYDPLKECLGVEGAQKIIRDAVQQAGLQMHAEYSKEDALKICEALKTKQGFVQFLAINLRARFAVRDLY